MASTTFDLDEDLTIEEGNWRGRLITFAVLLLAGAFAVAAVYYYGFRDEEVVTRPTEDIPVARTTINTNLIISGVADTQLNSDLVFQTSGKVAAVSVKVGDQVTQGQVLASLEAEDLDNAIASSQASLRTAQLRLADLLSGSTDAELAGATQAVAQAQSALTKAQDDYQELLDGPSPVELTAAQQGVSAAEAQVAAARSTREKLDADPSSADLAAAEAGVALAESALTSAENSAASAGNSVNSAAASLKSAQTSYCVADVTPAFCTTAATPISSGDEATLNAALGGTNAAMASAVIAANSAYLNSLNARASAEAAVESAENSLASAEEKLALVREGPSAEEVAAADAAVLSAEASLAAAREKLADVQAGANDLQLATAAAALDSAIASLASAEAKQAEAIRGPKANAVQQAREAVTTASLTVEAASIRRKNAQIIAPFDGTVAAVNIAAGEFASLAGTEPAIVLLTPDRIVLTINVGETDYAALKQDQGGVVIFDGIPGKPYPFRVASIGLSPTVTQGVVTYEVSGEIVLLPGNPRPAPGMNARGQITTESKADVIAIPPRAIRRRGTEQVVDVRRDGTVVEQVVTTGVSDLESVEVLTGLAEGEVLVVPALTAATEAGTNNALRTPLPNNIR